MPPRRQKANRIVEGAAEQHLDEDEVSSRWSGGGPVAGDVEKIRHEVDMDLQDTCPELADQNQVATSPDRTNSDCSSSLLEDGTGGELAASDVHAERRVMGAAATVASAAGMMIAGPVSGAALGAAALYAATREGSTGKITRKVGSTFLQVTDRAVDVGLQAADTGVKKVGVAVEKGCHKLSKDVDLSSMPAPVRIGVHAVLNSHAKPLLNPSVGSQEANRIREKYPDRVPVICERSPYSTGIPEMKKKKFIVPGSMLCGEFKYMVHKNLSQALTGHRGAEQTIYIFVNGLAPKTSTPLSDLYEKFRADDGFLYIKYGAENTLG